MPPHVPGWLVAWGGVCVCVREREREGEGGGGGTWGQCPTLGRTMKSSTESKFS